MSGEEESAASTIGSILQQARAAKGLTIEAAAAASRVPLSFVRLMEQEQFHLIPDPLYLTRFFADYATFLGLDPRQFETQLKDQCSSARMAGPPHPMPSIDSRMDLRRLALYLLPVAVVIPLIFIGLSLFSGRPPAVPPDRQVEAPESQGATAPLPEAATAVPPDSQAPPLGAEQSKELTPARQATAPAVQESQSPPARYKLRAEAKEMTWLSISADGEPRKQALLRAGETASWSANNGFVVTIGNVGGVVLSLNGRPIPLKETPSQVIRDLVLPGDGGPPLAGQ